MNSFIFITCNKFTPFFQFYKKFFSRLHKYTFSKFPKNHVKNKNKKKVFIFSDLNKKEKYRNDDANSLLKLKTFSLYRYKTK